MIGVKAVTAEHDVQRRLCNMPGNRGVLWNENMPGPVFNCYESFDMDGAPSALCSWKHGCGTTIGYSWNLAPGSTVALIFKTASQRNKIICKKRMFNRHCLPCGKLPPSLSASPSIFMKK
jgi:hypothetical protein